MPEKRKPGKSPSERGRRTNVHWIMSLSLTEEDNKNSIYVI